MNSIQGANKMPPVPVWYFPNRQPWVELILRSAITTKTRDYPRPLPYPGSIVVLYASTRAWVGAGDLTFMLRNPLDMRKLVRGAVAGFALVTEVGPTATVMPLADAEYFQDVFGYNYAGTYSIRVAHPFRLPVPMKWSGRGNPGVKPHQRVPPDILNAAADYFDTLPANVRKRLAQYQAEVEDAASQLERRLEHALFPHEAKSLEAAGQFGGIEEQIATGR